MINSGGFERLLTTNNASILLALKEQLVNTSSYMYLIIEVERIFAFIIQIALSLLVLYGVKNYKKFLFVLYAIIIHASVDFVVIFSQSLGLNVHIIAGLPIVMAIVSIFVIKRFKVLSI
ncbi:hypothetical protein COK80_07435 [Bacillus anthracis]|nr:hypothetical protein COK80_07435 [Bacillus anthracis]PGP11676.1 hypothetical protein CN994_27760 [Bacillus anthracis]